MIVTGRPSPLIASKLRARHTSNRPETRLDLLPKCRAALIAGKEWDVNGWISEDFAVPEVRMARALTRRRTDGLGRAGKTARSA
jgi:hypothetical protein